jgi:hypothetical protein
MFGEWDDDDAWNMMWWWDDRFHLPSPVIRSRSAKKKKAMRDKICGSDTFLDENKTENEKEQEVECEERWESQPS